MIDCLERNRLQAEQAQLFAQYLVLRDEVKQTSKRDPSYGKKSEELNRIKGQFKHALRRLHQHIEDHSCR